MKPDIVAVGENVYSAAQTNNPNGVLYNSSHFALADGTSFSSPMVAGAAAVIKQLHPSYSPANIKSALVNTASRNLTIDGVNQPNIMEGGAGLLDIGAAASATALFSPATLSFGVTPFQPGLSVFRSFTISNLNSSTDQFSLSLDPLSAVSGLNLSSTSIGPIQPGGTVSIDLTFTPTVPNPGAFQGFVKAVSVRTGSTYRIAYWGGVYQLDSSRVLPVQKDGSGSFSNLADAISSAQPGNIIEIKDSGTYAGAFTLTTNHDGLPLHGLVIRAAPGTTPVIAPLSTSADFNLSVVGLQNVLLQGLKFSGGAVGLYAYEASATKPLSLTVDHCTFSDNSGTAATAIFAEGGQLNVTKSTITENTAEGIAAYYAFLTVMDTTVNTSGGSGLHALQSDLQVLNSTFSNGSYPRANLDGCTGTIEGSTFSGATGTYGDGIYLTDGVLTLRNNTITSNERAGLISFTNQSYGTRAWITGNTISNNRYGLYFNPGYNLVVESNFLKGNGRGIRCAGTTTASLKNNIIVKSTDTSAGDGIQVAGTSNTQVINNTIYGNIGRGITNETGTSIVIANSIISSNTAGDLSGINAANIQYSLIGDGSLSANGNIKGDPKFTNASGDDYSLAPDSPALDAGTNVAAGLPLLDYNRQLRTASISTRPGEGKVDMGAIEYGSAYPLFFPLLANGVQSTLGDDFTTGVALLNGNPKQVQTVAIAAGTDGSLLSGNSNPASRILQPGEQVPILGFQMFSFPDTASLTGGVIAASSMKLTGFFLLFDRQFKRFADGIDVSDNSATDLIFMRHLFDSTGKAKYTVFNPGVNVANITATLYSQGGTAVGNPVSMQVAPQGLALLTFETATLSSGFVRVQSDRPVSGLEIFGDTEEVSALKGVTRGSDGRLFFPHFAVNGGFMTQIGIVNPTGADTAIALDAYQSDGTRIGNTVITTIPAGGQLLNSVDSLFGMTSGSLVTGYIVARSDVGGIAGFTSFRYSDGKVRSSASVPASAIPRGKLIFSHVAHQVAAASGGSYQTGIALLNPFSVPVSYTISVFDGAGTLKASRTDLLGPQQKVSKLLSHPAAGAGFFTDSLALGSGHVEVTSDYGLLGFELFFTEDVSQLASVPAQFQ